jgi:uncharacterized protein (TIGR03382 family)
MKRLVPVVAVLGAAALAAAAVGDGRVVASQPVLVINGSSGTDTLQNTSSSSFPTLVTQDPSCASGLSFQIASGNPFTLGGSASKTVQLGCPTGTPGMARCLLHATESATGVALADFLQVCITGTSSTLQPGATLVDFTANPVPVGGEASLSLNLHNAGAATFARVSLQTSALDGNFGFALPCNLAAPYCAADIAPVASGSDTTINVLCTPTTPGLHTATLYVATDSSQVLSQAVTLKCNATASATPVLEVNPASIEVTAAVEVGSGSATSPLHLTNAGSGTLMLTDVRAVDVDTGAAIDWSYVASGHCSGHIPPSCQLGPGDVVDLAVTFDPSAIGALSSTTTPATLDVTIDPAVEGDLTDQIVVTTSDQTIKIPVTGRVVKPAYTVPPMLDIGTFCINQPTTQSNVALQSTGTATIELAAPALTAMSSSFELSTTTPASYPTELSPGQSAVVAITPHPQQARTTLTDTITWTTDVEGAPTATTQLTATFIDSGGAIAPPALDFGKVTVHLSVDNGQRVVIQNCNGSPLMLDAPTIKAPFSIDSPNIPSLLQPNETATFSIGFHPTRLGTFTGALQINSQQLATPLMVALSGEGAPGDPGVDAGSATPPHPGDSGCGCHTTGVGGTAPVLVVVLVMLRRRRIGYARWR